MAQRITSLDLEMDREIDDLRQRYQAKRQPILDAMDQKRRRQQDFYKVSTEPGQQDKHGIYIEF